MEPDSCSDTSSDEEISKLMAGVSLEPKAVTEDTPSVFTTTKHEIGQNDLDSITKFFPKLVGQVGDIAPLGTIQSVVDSRFVVSRASPDTLDLENFICDETSNVIGFIEDVIGPVQEPIYVVGLYADYRERMADGDGLAAQIGKTLFFVQKTKKLVFWNRLLQSKGTDASNMHDEEIPESEQAFSDDEDERNYKRLVRKVR
jgi:H/ACA ribonucleoprotein complex non-core subunit NAF1